MEITLTQILTELKDFSEKHIQLQSFGFGPLSNISTTDTLYPILWIDVAPSYTNGHALVLTLDMYICELQKQDYSNLETIMNKTLLIGSDIISRYWENGEDEGKWNIKESTVRMQPFEYKNDDVLAGWVFSIEIEIENRLNSCDIPE